MVFTQVSVNTEIFNTGQCLRRLAGGNAGLPLDTGGSHCYIT